MLADSSGGVTIGHLIRRLGKVLDSEMEKNLAEHSLSRADWELLDAVANVRASGEAVPSAVARQLGITPGSVTPRLDRLATAGLITRGVTGEGGDGRNRPVQLTDVGERRWREVVDARNAADERLIAGNLSVSERDRLSRLLRKLALGAKDG